MRRLLISRLRGSIKVSSFLGMVCGSQCKIRVVWGLNLISLAAFHGFPFLPCRLTSLELNICVLHSLRILPFYIIVQPIFLKSYAHSLFFLCFPLLFTLMSVCHKVVCNSGVTFSFSQFGALGREICKATNVQFPFILILVRNDAAGTPFVGIALCP